MLKKNKVGRPKIYAKNKRWGTDMIYCDICQCFIQRRIKSQHRRTNKHISKIGINQE